MNPGHSHQSMVLALLCEGLDAIGVLAQELGLSNRQVADAAAGLIRKGYAVRNEAGSYEPTDSGKAFQQSGEQITSGAKTKRTLPDRSLRDTMLQRSWNAMRIQKKFTIDDIVAVAAHGTERDPRRNVGRYFAALTKAGILRELPRREAGSRPTSNGFKRFLLVNDLGPAAPSHNRVKKHVHDFNSGKDFQL